MILAIGFSGQAQTYLGFSIGNANAEFPDSTYACAQCSKHDLNDSASVYKAFIGYRARNLAVETGFGSLSRYRSHNVGPLPDGVERDIHQDIDTQHTYLRGIAYKRLVPDVEVFASLGLTRVSMQNHEWGYNDPSQRFVEQKNDDIRYRPMYGLGLEAKFTKSTAMRVEATHIRNVAVSRWTLEHNVTSGWLGLVVKL